MLPRRLAASARPLASSLSRQAPRAANVQIRHASQAEVEDPEMNGGYVNPPMEKRQFRDPYGDWWDKQQRRNFGEPVHEDEDILGTFSPEEYTWTTPGKAGLQLLAFGGAVATLLFAVSLTYPDKPSAPREFENGLSQELGGDRAVRARKEGEGQWKKKVDLEES